MGTLGAVQIVINPRAGNGNGLALAERLESSLRGMGRDARTLVVHDLVEACVWLERNRADFDYLFCLGGDNTLSEIAPFALRHRIPLVPVPTGFGNIFARTFGHRAQISFLLHLLEHGEVRWVDVGVAGGEAFLSSRGFGLLEVVKRTVEEQENVSRSSLGRYLAYARAALRMLKTAALPAIRVEMDGEVLTTEAAVVIVANVPTYRGFITFTPTATPFDGLLDVFVIPAVAKRALIALLLAFLAHFPHRWRGVVYRQGKRVSVKACADHAEEIAVLPHALPVLAPPVLPCADPRPSPLL